MATDLVNPFIPADASITAPKLSGAQTGTAPIYGVRAWVNFNGVSGAIQASANITSVVKNGTGDYTINFTTAMPDANYAISGNCESGGGNAAVLQASSTMGTLPSDAQKSASSCRVFAASSLAVKTDAAAISVFFIR